MLTSVQLLLWTLSGVYFSFVDIDYVRGHQYEAEAPSRLFDLSALQKISVSGQRMTILERLPGELIVGVRSEGVMSWRNAQGDALGYLSSAEALDLARQRTTLDPDVVEWVERGAPGSEYRGAPVTVMARIFG
jgi:hypothetical protein